MSPWPAEPEFRFRERARCEARLAERKPRTLASGLRPPVATIRSLTASTSPGSAAALPPPSVIPAPGPISAPVPAAFVAWRHPTAARIRRTRPVTRPPRIAGARRIPIATHPRETCSGARGHVRHRRRGRRSVDGHRCGTLIPEPDPNAHPNARERAGSGQNQYRDQSALHDFLPSRPTPWRKRLTHTKKANRVPMLNASKSMRMPGATWPFSTALVVIGQANPAVVRYGEEKETSEADCSERNRRVQDLDAHLARRRTGGRIEEGHRHPRTRSDRHHFFRRFLCRMHRRQPAADSSHLGRSESSS